MTTAWYLLKTTASRWSDHNTPRLGAALAYYTVLSMAPLLVVAVAIAGFIFGDKAARGEIVNQVSSLVGDNIANIIQDLLKAARAQDHGTVASIAGVITLLVGASAVFGELRDSLNLIWDYKAEGGLNWKGMVKFRLFTFTVVLVVGFMLLVSLVVNAALTYVTTYLNSLVSIPKVIDLVVAPLLSIAVTTVLFALIYKYLPEVAVQWRDVWAGAAFTAVLFGIGRTLIGLYLGKASVGSAYGAAGSLVVLLVWVYYSSQIFFFGAEFTKVYADWREKKNPTAAR